MVPLAVIAPYRELAEISEQVCMELAIKIPIYTATMPDALTVARNAVKRGAEVLISRGGVALTISNSLDVPVVEIAVSAFDIVRAVTLARQTVDRIGVVGYRNVIRGSKSLEPALGISIDEIEIASEAAAHDRIARAVASGVQALVGDTLAVRIGKAHNLQSYLISSGRESVQLAFRQAQELAQVRSRERAKAEQVRVILDYAFEGVIATDTEGRISLINPAAQKILGVRESDPIGSPANSIIPQLPIAEVRRSGQARLAELCRIGSSAVVANILPVRTGNTVSGVVATLQDPTRLQAAESKVRRALYLKGHVAHFSFSDILASSPAMRQTLRRAEEFAPTDSTVMITGETGTGKELLAQGIHNASRRAAGPFIAVNCAAVPVSLLESELFGHEEGAFTGARRGGRKGYFELAHAGTLFLDEIGELPPDVQARLLRVLQERSIMRVGGDQVIPVDVRILAATHRDIEGAVRTGAFRRDLYYRLNVLRLHVPPLRDRSDDLQPLAQLILQRIARQRGRPTPALRPDCYRALSSHAWPGNVRELENILERIVVLNGAAPVTAGIVRGLLQEDSAERGEVDAGRPPLGRHGSLAEMEWQLIQQTLQRVQGNKAEACRLLGISRPTLWRRLNAMADPRGPARAEGGSRRRLPRIVSG